MSSCSFLKKTSSKFLSPHVFWCFFCGRVLFRKLFLKKPERAPNWLAIFWGSFLWIWAQKMILEYSIITLFQASGCTHLTNKKAKTVLCSVIKYARKWREHERLKCRVNTSRRRVLLPTSWVLSSLPWVFYQRTKHGFGFFICFII